MKPIQRGTALAAVAGIAYCVYFVTYTSGGLRSWFSSDDLMNLHYYWSRPLARLVESNIAFFTDYYRPMGGVYYRAIYAIWGFDPLPFHVAAFVLLSVNLALLYAVTVRLTASRICGFLALILSGTHASFVLLYFDTGMIYDVLAYSFYWAAFLSYVRIRHSNRIPRGWQIGLILAVAVSAMNAKEIAVTFPLAILLYELIWFPPQALKMREISRWIISGPGRSALIGGLLVAVYIVGKILGKESLVLQPLYRPQISALMYLETYGRYLSQWLYISPGISPLMVLCILILASGLAVISRRKHLMWAALFNLVSVLPIAFIPARNGFAFYLPAVGWTVYMSGLLLLGADCVARVLLRSLAHLKQIRPETLHAGVRLSVLLTTAAVVLPIHVAMLQYPLASIHHVQDRNQRYWVQLRQVLPNPARGARVLIRDDPFPADTFDLYFLIRLMYADPTLTVDRVRQTHSKGRNFRLADYDYVLNFVDGRFVLM